MKKKLCPYCEKAYLCGKPLFKLTTTEKKKYRQSYIKLLQCPNCENTFIEDSSIKY